MYIYITCSPNNDCLAHYACQTVKELHIYVVIFYAFVFHNYSNSSTEKQW